MPSVFSSVENMNKMWKTQEPTTVEEYQQKGLAVPDKRSYAVNNNIIAAVDDMGRVHVALHQQGDKNRLEELKQATGKLDKMGYKEGNFYVPQFKESKVEQS